MANSTLVDVRVPEQPAEAGPAADNASASTSMTDAPVPFFKKRPKGRPASSRTKEVSSSPADGPSTDDSRTLTTTAPRTSALSKLPQKSILSQGTRRKRDRADQRKESGVVDVNWTSGTVSLPEGYSLSDEEREESENQNRLKRARLDPSGQLDDPDMLPDPTDDGLYHGLAGYKSHIRKTQEMPKAMRAGPVRATGSTIRTVTVTDYQPDVCKDYKETGYCGFGDTCKFLHDRGTYLAGWQLDRQWDQQQAAGGGATGGADADSSDEEDIPFACLLCRQPYTDPIVTKCGHYFCSACAIKRFAKTPKCAACGAPTGGMFNGAGKKVEAMRERMERRRKREEEGEEREVLAGEREVEEED